MSELANSFQHEWHENLAGIGTLKTMLYFTIHTLIGKIKKEKQTRRALVQEAAKTPLGFSQGGRNYEQF